MAFMAFSFTAAAMFTALARLPSLKFSRAPAHSSLADDTQDLTSLNLSKVKLAGSFALLERAST